MYICPKCYFQTETPAKFCPHCGTGMNNVEPEAPAVPSYNPGPTYTPYSPSAPTYAAPYGARVPEEGSSVGKKVTGMILAVLGLIFALAAISCAIEASNSSSYSYYGYYYSYGEDEAAAAVILAVLALPLSIVGVALSSTDGKMKGFGIAGKICGIIGIVLAAIGFIAGAAGL